MKEPDEPKEIQPHNRQYANECSNILYNQTQTIATSLGLGYARILLSLSPQGTDHISLKLLKTTGKIQIGLVKQLFTFSESGKKQNVHYIEN